jgi:hypothetical protein
VCRDPPGNNHSDGFALQATPVVAQGFERGTEHDIAVLTTFATADVDHHTSAVDIGNLQARQLGTPYPCAIERHQYHAMKPSLGRVDEVGHFFRAQDAGQGSRLLRMRCIGHAPSFLDRLRVKEPQSREPLRHSGCG